MPADALKDAIKENRTELEPCSWKIEYTIPGTVLDNECEVVLKEFSKVAELPGFRKGKAPKQLIKKRFQDRIDDELVQRCVYTAFQKTSEDEEFEIVSYAMPKDTKPEYKAGEDLAFEITFDTAPQFELPEYKKLEVAITKPEIADKDIDAKLEEFREMYADYVNVEGAAEAGDMLKVNYSSDFELPEEASATLKRQVEAEEGWIWLNEPEIIPGAIKALTGAEKDKEYTFTAEYAEDYREADLSGKKVEYKVKVLEVQRRKPLEDDEQLCTKMGVKDMAALRERVSRSLEMEGAQKQQGEIRTQVLDKLIEQIDDFPIPPSVLAQEVQKELRQIANREVKKEEDAKKFQDDIDKFKEEAEEAAKKRMKRAFILREIAKREDIKVENSEMDAQLKNYSRYYGYRANELRRYMEQSGRMDDLQLDMLMEKVTGFLADNAEIKES